MKFGFLAIALIGCAALVGCKEETASTTSGTPTTKTAAVMDNCYVCGEHEVEVLADTARLDHEGKTYYFCADDCKEVFTKNPVKYVARRDAREAKPKG